MNELSIIVLTSMLTAILTLIVNRYSLFDNYKHDYYKMIIEKRIVADENFQPLFVRLNVVEQVTTGEEEYYRVHKIFCHGVKEYMNFVEEFARITCDALWQSPEAYRASSILNEFLIKNIDNKLNLYKNANSITVKELKETGKNIHKELIVLNNRLYSIYRDDILKLHDVKSFLKNKIKTEDL